MTMADQSRDPQAASIDKEWLRNKYREERDKRLRPDGNDQYIEIKGQLTHYLDDPYTPVTPRAPKTDHVTFAFVGGGFAGLATAARLKEAGIDDVRIIEKAGDFGGTWYWNRYPGAQCDTASMVYMPLLEETGHMPSEKYAHAPEILAHCQRIGRQFGLYDNALLHTEVAGIDWDQAASRWRIRTNRGDDFTAQFVGMGTGPLHVPKLPGIPGIESFEGHSFHTSRWDYDYTGGDPLGQPMHKLADKRVGIIGTGATSVQCVPHLAQACKELYVFQRTPSSVDVRDNAPIDPDWFSGIATTGWQQRWLENFTANQAGGTAEIDLVQDGWTDLGRRIRAKIIELPREQRTPQNMLAAFEDADFGKMEEIRARVDTIVHDRDTAAKLKAWYRQLCKRPCFHDSYLQAFNRPGAHLVDTDGKGVEKITDNGVVVAGKEYQLDCIIYASGFEVGTAYERRAGFDLTGRGGLKLSDYWAEGMRSKHGIHVHGFPNAFFVQPAQGANLISNVPHNLTDAARTIALTVSHARKNGFGEVEVTKEAEDRWIELLLTGAGRMLGSPDCTPGYYNNEGREPGPQARLNVGYPAGPNAYFKYIDEWRDSGRFDGLAFR
ncbi:NAD(P)/FAD-dependent oxidoreductase [Bradyrhizobium manausense]|uniref:flavin-containing monooxygenase n=1 Tax=Bradyrhizobium TaxID=374 RepID=UPI001BAD2FB0|nr:MULTISPECIES: NAD(P)/FAD-dependent oxidoreductase [Bradyrhizobium]MBR0824479.1 NAD(P)/FAD-dependent oxidoreductase [Bradyrhizobium manausense]UVO26866.1 NAD(P)/FAD-dependent oxidoreductase [Bradyrhizobium arachidis]